MAALSPPFWSLPASDVLQRLQTTPQGLSAAEARRRLLEARAALLQPQRPTRVLTLLVAQFKSPIVVILLSAATLALFLSDLSDALIILVIIVLSALLGFWQEYGAARAAETLLARIRVTAEVLRDGAPVQIPVEAVVPGDIALFAAGDTIPADCLILEAKDLFVDEAALTGETYPVEKTTGVLAEETPLGRRTNSLFMGTHVVSGSAIAVVAHVGRETEFGRVAERLALRTPETEFERGIRQFGYLLLEVTLVLVLGIFAINVYLNRPVLESFLFSLALAVGLTPQLLPAIISINLAYGARRMAEQKVIVKRLASIENFGSMTVLCSDKTGTLTEGAVRVHAAVDPEGKPSERVLRYASLNAAFEKGFPNPIDEAIRAHQVLDLSGYQKLDEVPYDFVRKRLSVLVDVPEGPLPGGRFIITKGAVASVLAVCTEAATSDGRVVAIETIRNTIERRLEAFGCQGLRTLGVAYRAFDGGTRMRKDDEVSMIFAGFLLLADPPKPGIIETIRNLRHLGVRLKIISGDHYLVATHLAERVGLNHRTFLRGQDLHAMSDAALLKQVNEIDVFAEVEPHQKERIILALRKSGHIVGFIGDGINDALALHAADVGLSVEQAVDVAKEAADIVLLEKDLAVLVQGVREGRKAFANTLKYVFMATSANFGNMVSMAGASLILPFLPLLPKQILLTNFLTDIPEMTIATDRVDEELIEQPRRWNINFIRRFMITFGLISSVFDFLTFGALLLILRTSPELFRTGWFVESVISASIIVLVIRTRRPFFKSPPRPQLLWATLLSATVTLGLPFLPLGAAFGFRPLPGTLLLVLAAIVLLYMMAAELAKQLFYERLAV